LGIGLATNSSGHPIEARQAFLDAAREARAAGLWMVLAEAALAYGGDNGPFIDPNDTAALGLLRDAEELVPRECAALRAKVLARSAFWHLLDHDSRTGRDLAARARELAERTQDTDALAHALYYESGFGPSGLEGGAWADIVEQLCRLGAESHNTTIESAGRFGKVIAAASRGNVTEAISIAQETRRWAEELHLEESVQGADAHLRLLDIVVGRTQAARAELDGMDPTRLHAGFQFTYHGTRHHLETWYGSDTTAVAAMTTALESGIPLLALSPMEAQLRARQGRSMEAQESLRRWLVETRPHCPYLFSAMFDAGAADVLSRAPERDLAAAVFTGLERASGAWLYAVGGCWGAADLWLGVLDFILDRPADAEARMRAALQLNHQAGAVALEARAAIELARVVKE
jgi:hypothetical protein